LDYAVVLKGTVTLIVDGGVEKELKEYDVVVVRGTSHEWVNRGTEVARVFAVVVPALEIVTEGKRFEKTEAGPVFDPPEED